MVKVYVVTSGSYSDYRLEAIFKKEKDAEALNSVLFDGNGVDEWDINTRRLVPLWNLWMLKNGDIDDEYGNPTASIDKSGESIYTSNDENSGQFNVLADSLKRAVKVANERRAIILANNLWGDNEKIKELFFTNSKPL